MKCIRVAAATLNQTPLDWDGNKRRISAAIAEARRQEASVLCLPELCITGYGCEDAFLSSATLKMAAQILFELLPETRGIVISLGIPIRHEKAIYNACCLACDGKLLGLVAKHALAGDGIHYEPRWFKAWPAGRRTHVKLLGQVFPLGDFLFEVSEVKIGFEICEDAWTARGTGGSRALESADIILNPSASHFAFGKREIRERLALEGARAFDVSYVYSNLSGNEAGRAIYDGDALIASNGRIVARAERFGFHEVHVISAVVDVDLTRFQHARLQRFSPRVDSECVAGSFELPEAPPSPDAASDDASWESSVHLKHEEFARAVALGLFDYLRKSKAQGFVVSLSGGADSSAVAALVWLMVKLSIRELGVSEVVERLNLRGRFSSGETLDAERVCSQLLTTVYQATRNSSETTRRAARELAKAVFATHLELDVDDLVERYEALVSEALGRSLSWDTDDLALQNIQARARSPSVWFIANVKRALLLSTSNRSEAAVGYATMDGDTSGGLCPIAGIDKAFLMEWLSWLQSRGPDGIGALPALASVTAQQPTAELRPLARAQTDEADLMPYPLLDAIERAAIRDKLGPLDVYRTVAPRFAEYDAKQLLKWIERFFLLWSNNQWKRERYAPSFHVDDANLDPKTWCRFPILSGGFSRELAELREALTNDK